MSRSGARQVLLPLLVLGVATLVLVLASRGLGQIPPTVLVVPPGQSTPVPLGPPGPAQAAAGPVPREQIRAAGQAELDRMLSMAPRPPDAVPIAKAIPWPEYVTDDTLGWAEAPDATQLSGRRFWIAPMRWTDGVTLLAAGRPGLTHVRPLGWNLDGRGVEAFTVPDGALWIRAHMHVLAFKQDDRHTGFLAEARITMVDPMPFRDASEGPRVHASVSDGCPDLGGAVDVANTAAADADLDTRLLPEAAPSRGLLCRLDTFASGGGRSHASHRDLSAQEAATMAARVRAVRLGSVGPPSKGYGVDTSSVRLLVLSYPGRPDVDLLMRGGAALSNGHVLVNDLGGTAFADLSAAMGPVDYG